MNAQQSAQDRRAKVGARLSAGVGLQMNPPKQVRHLFERAGWTPSRSVEVNLEELAGLPHNEHAYAVLTAFGGLHVGESGAGRDCAKSDIEFFTAPSKWNVELVEKWQKITGPLTPIATAHHEHMELYLGQDGRCYVHTNPDGKLYVAADTFSEAAERLLLGFSLGAIVHASK